MIDLKHPKNWKYNSPAREGLHKIISPQNSVLNITHVFRLNLNKNESHTFNDPNLELNALLVKGKVEVSNENNKAILSKHDSFYAPSGSEVKVSAREDSTLYLGGAPCEGKGRFYIRNFEPDLPLGNIRQIHGKPPYRRNVFMTITQEDPGSRLICGITRGDEAGWTSWPPHQHTKDLEEVYFYFDIPSPSFAMHLSSRVEGKTEHVHTVSSGDCVIIPEGYHPTVGIPGVRSTYFWIMAAHSSESRRYDLAVNDPNFDP